MSTIREIAMHLPSITSTYLAVLALLYAALTVQVIRLRQSNRASFGDSGSPTLRSAIRAHANFAEYVPIIALMVAMIEMSGASALRVHLLMGALTISRLLHPLGMYVAPNTLQFRICRVGGMTITIGLLLACALKILSRILLGGLTPT
ncbi:MAPEG family protein [Bradyrhizobium sp. AZCC 2289]|uniref:MAPEG family protein n=1 Tax=Bradyrhizobium sp. AZCC 2289 TaxID=3117026 RepID=UPI002FF2B9C7